MAVPLVEAKRVLQRGDGQRKWPLFRNHDARSAQRAARKSYMRAAARRPLVAAGIGGIAAQRHAGLPSQVRCLSWLR